MMPEKGKEEQPSALFLSPKYAKLCLMANFPWGIEESIFVNSYKIVLKKYSASSYDVQNYIYRSLFKKIPNAFQGIGHLAKNILWAVCILNNRGTAEVL